MFHTAKVVKIDETTKEKRNYFGKSFNNFI